MHPWVLEEDLFSFDGKLDFPLRNLGLLFGETMRQYNSLFSMKEIQQPVVHSQVFGSKLVDIVTKEISQGPTKFMAKFRKFFDPNKALVLGFFRKTIQPFQERYTPILLPKNNYLCLWQPTPYCRKFATSRQVVSTLNSKASSAFHTPKTSKTSGF